MKHIVLVKMVALATAAPQYDGQTQDLPGSQLDAGDGYSEQQNGKLNEGSNGVEVIVQIVKNEDGYIAPDDYQTTQGDLTDKATTSVDNVFENCADYTASQGYECVPYYQCHNGSIITDGGGLIDIRNGFGILSPEDSKCPGFLDVCCLDPDFIPPPPPPVVKHVPKCGQRHKNGLGVRIQGFSDYESQFGEWPHMCAVLAEEPVAQVPGYAGEPDTVNLYQCGGSLIAPGVILTAAHWAASFLQEPQKLKIRCGEWDTQSQTEPREHQDRDVTAVDVHPEFNTRNLANDWALLYTVEDFDLQAHIDTVCLPEPEELFDATDCFATGWGKDQFGAAGQYQVVLKEIGLPVVGHDQCQSELRKTRLGSRFKLDNSFICAGGSGKDTCKGDGGSPLVCPSKYDPNSYVQAGIVAWGIGCGEDNTPGVYASVSKGVCWIDYAMSCRNGRQSGSYSSYWGYSANQCQTWMDKELSRLNQEVAAMQSAASLRGRKKAAALAAGVKAQNTLNQYNQCSVFWAPLDAQPLTAEVEGGYVDVLPDERDAYPAVDPAAPLTEGSYIDPAAPLTNGAGTKTDCYPAAQLTDGSSSDPKAASQTVEPYAEAPAPETSRLAEEPHTAVTEDLTGQPRAPGPVY